MPISTFSGTVEDGQVKLSANVHLPEKTKVYVVVPDFEEQANGKKFDLKALNDFILAQGLLPPDQLADAVERQFLPRYSSAPAH